MRCWLALLAVVVALLAAPASAQDVRDQARALAEEGIALLSEGRAAEAMDKLQAAEALFHAPTHLVYLARAHTQLDQLMEAHDTYVAVLIEQIPNYAPEAFHKARQMAESEATALRPRIATLAISVSGEAEVRIDGRPIERARLAYPVAVSPGAHTVAAGSARETVRAALGQVTPVTLSADAPPAPAPAPRTPPPADSVEDDGFPVLATIALAVGGAALGVGAVTGALTLDQASDIKRHCQGDVCPRDQEEAADDAKTLGNVSTAMFVAGGVVTALGIVLLVIDLSGDEAVAFELTPSAASLRARF